MVLAVFVLSKVRIMGVRCEFMIRLEVEQSPETNERNSRLLLLVIRGTFAFGTISQRVVRE